MTPRLSALTLTLAFLFACFANRAAVAAPAPFAEKDGILAAVRVTNRTVNLQWRFLRPPPAPITSITADSGGQPLRLIAARRYPQPGDVSDIMFLFDLTDPRRAKEITRDKALALQMMVSLDSHHSLGLAYYGARTYLLDPKWTDPNQLIDDIVSLAPLDQKPDRDTALLTTTVALGTQAATRRAIYVLTDGYDAAPQHRDEVIGAALHYGVSITFITANSQGVRPVNVSGLRAIAAATGGQLVTAKNLIAFLRSPYRLLDSGGEAYFSLKTESGTVLPPGTPVRVRIAFGNDAFDILSPSPTARPNQLQSLLALATRHLPLVGGAAATLALVLLGLLFRRLRAHRKPQTVVTQPANDASVDSVDTEESDGEETQAANRSQESNADATSPSTQRSAAPGAAAAQVPTQPGPAIDPETLDELWNGMLGRLRRQGGLPAGHDRLTFGELASKMSKQTGGEQFSRLIAEWYYPRQFGATHGAMSDQEAREIMTQLFRSGRNK